MGTFKSGRKGIGGRWSKSAIITLTVLSLLLVPLLATVVQASPLPDQATPPSPWNDLSAADAEAYGLTLGQLAGVSEGYADGTWRPYQPITRAEFTKMAVSAFGVELRDPQTPSFSDVPKGSRYYQYIEGAKAAGLANGVAIGWFKPDEPITRQQGIAIVARYAAMRQGVDLSTLYSAGEVSHTLAVFGDAGLVTAQLQNEVVFAIEAGIAVGDRSGRLTPFASLTRIQGAALPIRGQVGASQVAYETVVKNYSEPADFVTYEESDGLIEYSGSWGSLTGKAYSGGSLTYASAVGAGAKVAFVGDRLTLVAKTGPSYGTAEVILDGKSLGAVSYSSKGTSQQQLVYDTGKLAHGYHELTILCSARGSGNSSMSHINVDAVRVAGQLVALRQSMETPPVSPSLTTSTTVALVTSTTLPPTTSTAPVTTTTVQPTTTTVPPTTTTAAPITTTTTAAAPQPTTTVAPPATTSTTVPFNLQQAIDAAGSGATIAIPSGTYKGPFRISGKNGLTLSGSGVTLTSTGIEILGIYNSSSITVDGLTLVGDYGYSGQRGIGIFGLNGGAFRNLVIRDVGFAGIFSNGASSNVTVSNSSITRCGDFGVIFQGGYNGVTISNIYASDFAGKLYPSHAIYLKDGSNFTVRDSDVGRAYGPGGGVSAIQIGNGAVNGSVVRNVVRDSPFGVLIWGNSTGPTRGVTVSDNVGRNNSQADFAESGTSYIDAVWTNNVGSFKINY